MPVSLRTMTLPLLREYYRGFGSLAERLMLQYAFDAQKMSVVYADAVLKNVRSQHVLEKVGFERTEEDGTFVYYRLNIDKWKEKF